MMDLILGVIWIATGLIYWATNFPDRKVEINGRAVAALLVLPLVGPLPFLCDVMASKP